MRKNRSRAFARPLLLTFIAAGVAAAIALPAPARTLVQSAAPASAPPGNAERGRELYVNYYCYSCHGWSGHGGAGPAVANSAYTAEGFIQYVRKPAGGMPAYISRVMSDQQLSDVYSFLGTIPPSPAPDSIPLLDYLD